MDLYLFIAGILTFILGIVHSILGEKLIFKRLRATDLTLLSGSQALSKRHLRTLWSTWQLVTLFGFGLGSILIVLSLPSGGSMELVSKTISLTFAVSSIFWGLGTHGKHPAWLILLIIAVLSWVA